MHQRFVCDLDKDIKDCQGFDCLTCGARVYGYFNMSLHNNFHNTLDELLEPK